jgi:hypothetical protein
MRPPAGAPRTRVAARKAARPGPTDRDHTASSGVTKLLWTEFNSTDPPVVGLCEDELNSFRADILSK